MKTFYFIALLICSKGQLSAQANPQFELGAKWTYEREVRIPRMVDFVTYEVMDTLTIDSLSCFIVDNVLPNGNQVATATMCISGNKVLVPDNRLGDGFQLIYDFDAIDTFRIQCAGLNEFFECAAPIDSIETVQIADGQLITRRKIDAGFNSECASGGFISSRVYDGIGNDYGGLFRNLDFCNNLADPVSSEETRLRCFENSTASFRFVDYPCDTIIQGDGTDVIDIMDGHESTIFPNPARGVAFVDNPTHDLTYRLFSMEGRLISEGTYLESGIELPYQGIYIVMLYADGREWTQRVLNTL